MALKRPHEEYEESYYIQTNTKNKSFIRTALLLKYQGIENYNFCLKLYDKDLMYVDPYDPDLDMQTRAKIALEINRNYYYYLREIARVPEEGAPVEPGGGIEFQLHRGNLAQAWCFDHNISHYLELPRQFGKTTGAVHRYQWQFSYGTTSSSTVFLNMNKGASVANLTRLKDSRSLLPIWLQMNYSIDDKGETKKDTENVNEIKNKKLKNTIITKASASSDQSAEQVGRGLSIPSIWYDEFAFTKRNEIIYAAAAPAYIKSSENAAKNDRPYGICITSTPGDLGENHGRYAFDLKENAGKFTERLYDMDSDDVNTWIDKNSSNNMIYISFTFLQLGKTMDWFEKQCKVLNNNWLKIRRELLLQWNKASSNSPFSAEDIDELDTMARTAIKTLKINKYYDVLLYKELDGHKKYLVGVDVSKGVGRDATAVAIVDPDTLECVGLFINNTIRSRELKRFLSTLILDHLPNSVLVIESNNIGDAIIEDLKFSPLKHNLYYDFSTKLAEETRKNGTIQKKSKNRMVYGHEVTSNTRPKMMDLLLNFVSKHKSKIAVKELVDQIKHLEYKNEERIDHGQGKHDDAIFAYLAAIYIMFYGKNLPRFGLFNRFNFDEDGIVEDTQTGEDKVGKILKASRIKTLISKNPFLAGIFEDLLTGDDLEKRMDRELWDAELNSDTGNSIYTQEANGFSKKVKPNAFLKLNASAMRSLNKSTNSVFGIESGYNGRGW